MKNILFPTDFSDCAHRAFIYALHIADKWQARITTLHVFQRPDVGALHLPKALQEFYNNFDLYEFENYKDDIPVCTEMARQHGFGHLDIVHILKEGTHVVDTILQVAQEDECDFIVMGTTGAGVLKEIFLGSVAGEVMENASCPVLAIPEKADFDGSINRLAFTTSFQEEEKIALEKVLEFALPFSSQVHCINVDLAHTDFYLRRMEYLKEEFKDREHLSFQVLDGNDIYDEITRYLETHQIDILAMVSHKRTFLQELFHYSKAKMMSHHAKTPVLAYQAHNLTV